MGFDFALSFVCMCMHSDDVAKNESSPGNVHVCVQVEEFNIGIGTW